MKSIIILLFLVGCTPVAYPGFNQSVAVPAEGSVTAPSQNTTNDIFPVSNNTTGPATNTTNQTKLKEPAPVIVPEGEVLPNFSFQYPREGSKLPGDAVSVSLRIQNFTIGEIGTDTTWGHGHFVVTIDDDEPIIMEDASKTIRGLSPGTHVMKITMVQNDGTSYGVSHLVTFEAQTVTAH